MRVQLDEGEAEVIQLAKEARATTVIIDEKKGRRVAKSLGLRVRGTLGILLELKKRGLIKLVKPVIDEMLKEGYYLSSELIAEVLRAAGEVPGGQDS